LAYIHEKGIIHRDLKPANVLMNNDLGFGIKLGDFGLAIEHLDDDKELTAFVGSPHYRSPEVDVGLNSKYDSKADMFSAGLMLLECYFLNKNKQIIHQLFVSLRDGNSRTLDGFPDSNEMKLIKRLTTYEAENRLSASQVLEALANPGK
jgi:serine/threonine protein kinase